MPSPLIANLRMQAVPYVATAWQTAAPPPVAPAFAPVAAATLPALTAMAAPMDARTPRQTKYYARGERRTSLHNLLCKCTILAPHDGALDMPTFPLAMLQGVLRQLLRQTCCAKKPATRP